jgi:hypothetical protein
LVEARHTAGSCRLSRLARQAEPGTNCPIKACGQTPRSTFAGKSGSRRGLLSVRVDRQWSNKLDHRAAQARLVVVARELAGARREELKHKRRLHCTRTAQLPSKRVRNKQDGPKPVCYSRSIERTRHMSRLAIVATILLAVFGARQPVFAEEAAPEPGCVCGLSSDADLSSTSRLIFPDPAKASADERDSGMDGRAGTPRIPARHYRRSFAADSTSTEQAGIAHRATP